MASNDRPAGRSRRRIVELVAVLACAGAMVMIGSSLASGAGVPSVFSNGPTLTGPSGPSGNGQGNPTSNVNPAGHIRQRKCKKNFRGNRKHRKCRHPHKGKGTLHAPGQQK